MINEKEPKSKFNDLPGTQGQDANEEGRKNVTTVGERSENADSVRSDNDEEG